MNRVYAGLIAVSLLAMFQKAGGAEPLFDGLPFGVFVEESSIIPKEQAEAIGTKLGGKVDRLSNSILKVQGASIRVNVIEAASETDADSIYRAIAKMKTNPAFCVKKGPTVVEYPGNKVDAATATKASYELGLVTKPKQVHYRVVADIATVDKADYMAANDLFNLFLSPGSASREPETLARIRSLSEGFQFGNSLTLRQPGAGGTIAFFSQPTGNSLPPSRDLVRTSFANPENIEGIPYVRVEMKVTANESGRQRASSPADSALLAATEHWPVDDPKIVSLAKQITSGSRTDQEKVQAILEWLAPGKNLKYGGKTGSRWGVEKVLEQKFGHCWDSSDVFVTLARASGVPCRQVAGWLYGTSGHVWAEYLNEGKWQQVDPTGGGKLDCGIYHIPWFTTEDGEMPILYVGMPRIEMVKAE